MINPLFAAVLFLLLGGIAVMKVIIIIVKINSGFGYFSPVNCFCIADAFSIHPAIAIPAPVVPVGSEPQYYFRRVNLFCRLIHHFFNPFLIAYWPGAALVIMLIISHHHDVVIVCREPFQVIVIVLGSNIHSQQQAFGMQRLIQRFLEAYKLFAGALPELFKIYVNTL